MADARVEQAMPPPDLPAEQPPSEASGNMTVASASPSSSAVDASSKILRKGDLVRVAERREARMKNRDGGLGRIFRSIPISEGGHPFLYDVDFVLGGRICNIERRELMYTTADAEGLTEDASSMRARRKRNPSAIVKDQTEGASQPAKKKTKVSKKAIAKTAKKATSVKKTAVGVKRKAKNGKATMKRQKDKDEDENTVLVDGESPLVRDLYERQRREFERCFARLERHDPYGFFSGDPPPDHDEHYRNGDTGKSKSSSNDFVALSQPASAAERSPPESAASVSNVPPNANSSEFNFPDTPPFCFAVIRKRMEHGRYVLDRVRDQMERMSSNDVSPLVHPKGVDWSLFRADVLAMCDAAIRRDPNGASGGPGTLGHSANKIKAILDQVYERTGLRQMREMEDDESRHKFSNALRSIVNNEAAMQGKWRTKPFPERKYERLSSDVVCAGLSPLDERTAITELQTSLPDSFVGLSYTYNDTGQSEGWMKSVIDGAAKIEEKRKVALDLAHDDGVVRAQVQATMSTILIAVQDRVMTDAEVLKEAELVSANWEGDAGDSSQASDGKLVPSDVTNTESPDVVELPVWGIDCYTRRNITTCIEKDFDSGIALEFIEKWLLPAINSCPVNLAHNLTNAARILEGLSLPLSTSLEEEHADDSGDERWSHSLLGKALKEKMNSSSPSWLKIVAHQLRLAITTLGHDFFRVHPKGHGSIVLKPNLKANTLVTFYRGEVYPSWRWGEKMDAIELTQNRLGLRPNLPDFYNMALERPQSDPRGYGLLFVDGSRKAGHGSSLSHSCDPTCEVRVASLNGQLRLAMTTLREVELGEELTFDYNAVTESLNEYQSAVCLCGHGRCRGSFLHFATADCYQQVLNRNLPIAVRFSNIIKGCTKQVMSEADEKLLGGHGFGTAAFGAVSFKRSSVNSSSNQSQLDSMDNVPIWLRTYVADTLRYIEYERRALPIALLCDHLETKEAAAGESANGSDKAKGATQQGSDSKKSMKNPKKQKMSGGKGRDKDRPIPGCQPEPVFLFFSRKQSDCFRSHLIAQGFSDLNGAEVEKAMQKVAASCWQALGDGKKQYWKEQAILEWEKNGGREKALLEAERLAAKALESAWQLEQQENRPEMSNNDGHKKRKRNTENEQGSEVHPSRISFEAADSEGYSAMEQRIQQLTQALSRVGRVLDRHRESSLQLLSSQESTPVSDSAAIHSPLVNLSDEEVVHWIWYHEKGVVRSLLRACSSEKCISPSLLDALSATEKKHAELLTIKAPSEPNGGSQLASLSPIDARNRVNTALLEFREQLSKGLVAMDAEMRRHELEKANKRSKARYALQKKQDAEKKASVLTIGEVNIPEVISSVLNWMIDNVVKRTEGRISHTLEDVKSTSERVLVTAKNSSEVDKAKEAKDAEVDEFILCPWLDHYADRWKLEAAADLLLFFAHTTTFFAIRPYTPLESTPIEVYARELGNAVPRSVIETAHKQNPRGVDDAERLASKMNDGGDQKAADARALSSVEESLPEPNYSSETADTERKPSKSKKGGLCKPDDIITNVTITYRGDYVLSQLLQWYNGGIGQKPGLPDLLGCVLLPCMSGCWNGKVARSKKLDATRYSSEVRPLLLDWIQDPRKRGGPFPEQIRQVFSGTSEEPTWEDDPFSFPPVGSPILDLLVTSDDLSIRNIAAALSENVRSTDKRSMTPTNELSGSTADRLKSTVDEGMPAQAVANWVQCEDPNCLKWRKLPWHVDVDSLPETFHCSDNKWNPAANTCEAPEDTWDEQDEQLRNGGIDKDTDASMIGTGYDEPTENFGSNESSSAGTIDEKLFHIGARFDVLRTGKNCFSTGIVMDMDFSSSTKRVLFHFPKTQTRYDEWIEIGSSRISPLNAKQDSNKEKSIKQSGQAQARTIGSAAKGKVPDTGAKKKVVTNKVHPTEEVSSGKPRSLKASKETETKSGLAVRREEAASKETEATSLLGVRREEAACKNISLEKLSNDATDNAEDGTKAASVFVKGSAIACHRQIGQDAMPFAPNVSVSEKKSTTNPATGDRTHQKIASVPRRVPDGPKEERSSSVSKSIGLDATMRIPKKEKFLPTANISLSEKKSATTSATTPATGDRTHQQIACVRRRVSDGPKEERSPSVSKSIGLDAAMRIPKKEKAIPTATPITSVAIPRKVGVQSSNTTLIARVGVQGSNATLIGRIPRKTSPGLSSPRGSGVGVPNGTHHTLQFSVGMKTSGSPDKAMALRNTGQFSTPQFFPYNRPTPAPYDAARLGVTNGTHRPLPFSAGMRPDSAVVPQHDGRFGSTQVFPKDREDQMSRPATFQGHRFHPKFGGPPNKKQYDNRR